MLTTSSLRTKMPLTMDPASTHAGISNLLAAAVVSRSFCQMLLSDPAQAIQAGYMGKRFALSAEDAALIVSISARSLTDLARQVVKTLNM